MCYILIYRVNQKLNKSSYNAIIMKIIVMKFVFFFCRTSLRGRHQDTYVFLLMPFDYRTASSTRSTERLSSQRDPSEHLWENKKYDRSRYSLIVQIPHINDFITQYFMKNIVFPLTSGRIEIAISPRTQWGFNKISSGCSSLNTGSGDHWDRIDRLAHVNWRRINFSLFFLFFRENFSGLCDSGDFWGSQKI